MSKKILLFITLFLAGAILCVSAVFAQDVKNEIIENTCEGKEGCAINRDVFKGTFLKSGGSIKIDQEIDGDVIVMAKELVITSKIHGDVLAAAENIEINGDVDGDVRVMAKTLTINGKIGKNTNVLAIDVKIEKDAVLEKDLLISSQSLRSAGIIKGNLQGALQTAELGNIIEGNVKIKLNDNGKLIVYPDTKIGGCVTYTAAQNADIGNNVDAVGGIKKLEPVIPRKNLSDYFGKIVALFSMIALGMAAMMIDKKNTARAADEILHHTNKSIIYGLIYFIAIPLIAIILMFTLIGIPIALILLAFYLILLYAGLVFSGIAIGEALFKNKKEMWNIVVGMIIIVVLTSLPIIGFACKLVAIFIGMGAIINVKREMLKEQNG
ncbi:MAG: polymer-forming cytoskeletal protein [bacterium]